jgi:hypothetical protein
MSEKGAEGQLRRRAEAASAAAAAAQPPAAPPSQPAPGAYHAPRAAPQGGYWTFVACAIFLLFILYITGKGELKNWLDILIPAPPATPKAQGAGQAPSALGSAAPTPNAAAPAASAPSSASTSAGVAGIDMGAQIGAWINKQLGQKQ